MFVALRDGPRTAAEVLEALQKGLTDIDEATSPDVAVAKTRSLIACIEYSHGKLDPTLQNSLMLLAPFTSVVPIGPILDTYRDLLIQDENVQGLGTVDLTAAL